MLTYKPEPHSYSSSYAAFKYRVVDTGGTDFGGTDTSAIAEMLISVQPDRVLPVPADTTVGLQEDTVYQLTVTDFALIDYSTTGPVAGVFIDKLPVNGHLTMGTDTITGGQFIDISDIDAGRLTYTPDTHRFGDALDTIRFTLVERNGSEIITPAIATPASSITFNVAPVNDAPTDIRLANSTLLEHTRSLNLTNIIVDDVDAIEAATISVDDERFLVVGHTLQLKPGTDIDFESEQLIPLQFTATDEFGGSVEQQITLSVENIFEAPLANTNTISHYVIEAQPATLSFRLNADIFVDPDGDELTYEITRADGSAPPIWIAFEQATQIISIDADNADTGSIDLVIVASDPQKLSAKVDFRILFSPDTGAAEGAVNPEPDNSSPVDPPASELTTTELTATDTTTTEPVATEPGATESVPQIETIPSSGTDSLALQETAFEFVAPDPATADDAKPEFNDLSTIAPLKFTAAPDKTTSGSSTATSAVEQLPAALPAIPATIPAQIQQLINNELFNGLANNLDNTKDQFREAATLGKTIQVSTVALSTGLSVGYIIWILRGGVIVASMMSAMPAWRFIDPLPVLDNLEEDPENDSESLESMVRGKEHQSQPKKPLSKPKVKAVPHDP